MRGTCSDQANLIYGTMGLGGTWQDPTYDARAVDVADKAIHAAVDIGIKVLDTADIYRRGSSEQIVGEVLRNDPELAKQLRIQTKCGIIPGDSGRGQPTRYDLSGDYITAALDASLDRLNVDHVDTLLLHRPDPLASIADTAEGIHRAIDEGKIRTWGVSNMSTWQIKLLETELGTPAVNQLELSLKARSFVERPMNVECLERPGSNYQPGTVEYCAANGIEVQAWSPLAQGLYTPDERSAEPASAEVISVQHLAERLAKKYVTTTATIILWWLTAHPAGIKPVVGSSQAERISTYKDANLMPSKLSREEWYELLTVARGGLLP